MKQINPIKPASFGIVQSKKNTTYRAMLLLFVGLFWMLNQTVSASGVLYAVDRTGQRRGANVPSTLYSINTSTGIFTTIGSVGYSVTDLAWDQSQGILYAASSFRDPNYNGLIQIDTGTGAGSAIGTGEWGATNPGMNMSHITIDSAGNMFGAPSTQNEYNLMAIDVNTGIATGIGEKTQDIIHLYGGDIHSGNKGLFFDAADTLWIKTSGNSGDDLYTVDVTTGISSLEADPMTFFITGGIGADIIGTHGTYHADTNSYWNGILPIYITKFDFDTNSTSNLPLIDAPAGRGLSLAFAPVPVPAAVWLFGTGLISLISFSKRSEF